MDRNGYYMEASGVLSHKLGKKFTKRLLAFQLTRKIELPKIEIKPWKRSYYNREFQDIENIKSELAKATISCNEHSFFLELGQSFEVSSEKELY